MRIFVSTSPFLWGHPATPRCRLTPGFSSASGRVHRSGASAPIPTLGPFAAVGDGLVRALTAVSGDSSPERDHSPGSLSVAGSGRDTGGLAALPPAPTPPSAHGLSPALRSRTCAANPPARIEGWGEVSGAAPSAFWIRSDAAGLAVLALVAPLARFLLAKPHPEGCLMIAPAPAGGRSARAPSPVPPQGIARFAALHLARRC